MVRGLRNYTDFLAASTINFASVVLPVPASFQTDVGSDRCRITDHLTLFFRKIGSFFSAASIASDVNHAPAIRSFTRRSNFASSAAIPTVVQCCATSCRSSRTSFPDASWSAIPHRRFRCRSPAGLLHQRPVEQCLPLHSLSVRKISEAAKATDVSPVTSGGHKIVVEFSGPFG